MFCRVLGCCRTADESRSTKVSFDHEIGYERAPLTGRTGCKNRPRGIGVWPSLGASKHTLYAFE